MSDNLETKYTVKRMISALEQVPEPVTFLQDRLVKKVNELDSENIEIDITRLGQTLAAYVSREGGPTNLKKREFTTLNHVAPYIYEQTVFTPKDLKERLPGQTIYGSGSPKDRLAVKVGEANFDMRERRVRRMEQQLAEGLQTGKVLVVGKDVNYTIDYRMEAANLPVNLTTDKWGSTTEDKIAQMVADAKTIRVSGAGVATEVYMGEAAANLWLQDTDVLAYMDIKRVEMGEIKPSQLANQNATFLGTFRYIGLSIDIYSYQGTYVDEDGDTQYYIDTDTYTMAAASTVRVEQHFTVIENFKHGTMIGRDFPMFNMSEDGKKATLSQESGPLTAVHQPDGIVTRTVK